MSDDPGAKRWTREAWEKALDDERRAQAARPAIVSLGAQVQVELVDESGGIDAMRLVVVPHDHADLARGFLGAGTPLARTIWGHQAGASIPYAQDDIVQVRLVEVVPGDVPETGAAESRRAAIRRAVDRSETAETLRLALTVDVKWGSYDPDGLVPGDPEDSTRRDSPTPGGV